MSKISQYLNEHILGDISTDSAVRKYLSSDSSLLTITPERVAYPRITNDIRKIARFTHQLALKGHAISMTPRGMGTDQTGAAIGPGIIINTTAHMNGIFEFDAKQRLVRVQPGATLRSINSALQLQGCYIPSFPESVAHSTDMSSDRSFVSIRLPAILRQATKCEKFHPALYKIAYRAISKPSR
jgi:FAD/FMN-containing dehydrogenase